MNKQSVLTLGAALALFTTALPAFAGGSCCMGGQKCLTMMLGAGLVWLVVAPWLLQYMWNTVISALFNFKKATFVQALLFIVTMIVLCAPRHMMMGHVMCKHMNCHEAGATDDGAGADHMEEQGE